MTVPVSICEYLNRNQVSYSILPHPAAYTAQEEAAAAHVPGREWAKAVVCMADEQRVLAVLPAHYTVDFDRLRRATGARDMRLATETELARLYNDCEVGAMPPLAPLYGQQAYVDRSLTRDEEIVFNAGSHREAIRMPYRDFERVVKPVVTDFGMGPYHGPARQRSATKGSSPIT